MALFVGGQCVTLIQGGEGIWSSDPVATNHQELNVEKDSTTGVTIVHIVSGEYEFQALW
jgi:hypothetical protein